MLDASDGLHSSGYPCVSDPYMHLSVRRSTLFAVLASLAIHLIVLFVIPPRLSPQNEPVGRSGNPLAVQIPRYSLTVPKETQAAVVPKQKEATGEPRKPMTTRDSVIALRQKNPREPTPVPSQLPATAPANAENPQDMMSYINAARARRRVLQGLPNEAPDERGPAHEPTEDELRLAKVQRNLRSGTNGIFQILSMDSSEAAFSFRGWTTDVGNARREYVSVEIGSNKTIEIAIVRKMIELIRRYYKGNFNWESDRLGQVVILSARIEDNDGLEEFMLREFFGRNASPSAMPR